ncbi:DNA-binding MarR family transcriptional regulator [Pseudarthrobacter sp. PvP004]|uniref:Transcriptional regulator, MarR family n=2 Tax=Micrococcaceae TaxID=1268 RepID=A1R7M6_PAEAT|nr:putative transcriptional regulator, MarR family [Paenarthrobacter aurescens TC1]MBP2265378.1 DNA-binding MarR family transcriptional regulator [Pseudarthrobacter sp. PvP004]
MPDMERWPTTRLLSTAARLVEISWNEKLKSIGLTHAGVIAMQVLAAKGAITQAALAEVARVKAQTMGTTLARLELHGHVTRQRSDSDRRSHVVTLTDAGIAALAEAVKLEQDVLSPVAVDTARLREELRIVVRGLAGLPAPEEESRDIDTDLPQA